MAKPQNFREIRKQIILNNEFITFKNKTILFQNWIKSGLIYINDIIDDQGKISENYIINKLIKKSNWISEINILKRQYQMNGLMPCNQNLRYILWLI